MSDKLEEPKKLWLEFAGPEISLACGAAAVAALQAMTYLGVAHSAIAMEEQRKEFGAIENPTDEQRRDYELSKLMHESVAEPAKAAVDAAAIIYAHAILDAVIYRLCSISISIDSSAWTPFIQERKVSFSDLRQNSNVGVVQRRLLETYLAQLERESLLLKCDVLFKIVKPRHTRGVLKGFRYSRERLASLGTLRHDLVHKLRFHRRARQAKAKTEYLLKTGKFFVSLLSKHYTNKKAPESKEKLGHQREFGL